MIRPGKDIECIYVYRRAVDFRKQVNGLGAIVQHVMEQNPMSGHLYVFFNRAANKVKILYWERNGFVLYSKHLEQDRFALPSSDVDQVQVTGEQLNWLLDGIDISLMVPHQARHYDVAC